MHVLLWIVAAGLINGEGGQELIKLRSGHAVHGEVIKEKSDRLIVDIGFDVLQIPREQVQSRESDGHAQPLAGDADRRYGQSEHLYATADLPVRSINELVDAYGEAVVLIKTPGGLGSGFLVDPQGHCITNFHVIEGETRITVDMFIKSGASLVEKSITDVQIVAINPFFDLALLKLPPQGDKPYPRVYLGFYDEVQQGDVAFAVGNPEGLSRSVTQGIISNRNRNMQGQLYIQTSAPINPGNSGGPLFNQRGQVIGVTNMKRIFSEGLGFAIPVSYVKDFLKNRDAYSYNKDNPNTGVRYLDPPRRMSPLADNPSSSP